MIQLLQKLPHKFTIALSRGVEHAYHINPGIEKVVKKLVQDACQPRQE